MDFFPYFPQILGKQDAFKKKKDSIISGAEQAIGYAFLASDEASYINGAVIEVGGGMTL